MKQLLILKGLLITQMNHWVLFTVGITLLGIAGSTGMYIMQFMLLGFLPFLLFLPRFLTDKFIPFISYHVLAVAVISLVLLYPLRGELVPFLVFSAYIAGYTIASLVLRIRKKGRMEGFIHPAAAVGIPAFMHILQRYLGTGGVDHYYAIALIVFVGLYFICHYLERFQHFLADSSDAVGHVPEQAIFKTGIRLVGIFTVLGILVLAAVSRVNSLYGVFDGLFSKRENSSAPESVPTSVQPYDTYLDTFDMGEVLPVMPVSEPADTRWISVLFTVITCLLAAVAVFGLYRLFLSLRERFKLNFREAGSDLDSGIDIREKIDSVKVMSGRPGLFGFLNPRERIRRIYKKRVVAGKSLLIGNGSPYLLGRYTAGECGQILGTQALAAVYDKARYSGEECTPDDVKTAKMR